VKKYILLLNLAFCCSLFSQGFEWTEIQKILASDGQSQDEFGISVAIDGNYAVVGTALEDDGGSQSGAAYFFELDENSGTWSQVAKVIASDAQNFDNFGYSVAISGTYSVIGSRYNSTNRGAAYFFERINSGPNSGSWTQVARVTASDAGLGDVFGWSVGISGTYSVIGAKENDEIADNAGAAYFFERINSGPNSGSWTEVAKVTASNGASNDAFGISVGISGTYSVIGANSNDEIAVDAGAAYFFERINSGPNSGSWTEVAVITASDGAGSDLFGTSVGISGTYSVIGAENGDGNTNDVGAAYFFERNNSGPNSSSWTEVAKVTASDGLSSDLFGSNVAISNTLSVISAVGADNGGNNRGSAYFFERSNSGSWNQTSKFTISNAQNFEFFGASVALSNNYSLISAIGNDETEDDVGAVYFYELTEVPPAPEIYNFVAEVTSESSATFYADIADGGATTAYTFEYGEFADKDEFSYSNTIAGNSATINVGFEDNTNLTANTQYFVRASATNSVTWTQTEEISFWTLQTEPNSQPEFGQDGEENNAISLTYSQASSIGANGYLLLRSNSAINSGDLPNDSQTYTQDESIGNATVVRVISSDSQTITNLTGLRKENSWQFALVPYSEGDDPSTINYLTTDLKSITGFTIPTLGEWGMIAFGGLMLVIGAWQVRRVV
jgi:hypothetical protein